MLRIATLLCFGVLFLSQANAATLTGSTVDLNWQTQSFDFQISWSAAPQFFTTDSVGRQEDFFIYTLFSPSATCSRAVCPLETLASGNAEYYITGIHPDGTIQVHLGSNYAITTTALSVDLTGDSLSFSVPFSVLGGPGTFLYELAQLDYGATRPNGFFGQSDGVGTSVNIYSPLPIPGSAILFASGLALIALATQYKNSRVESK